jgi:hypothetical protein
MIKAVVYSKLTNKVLSTLSVPDLECLEANIQENQDYIISDWVGDITLASVVNGEVITEEPRNQTENITRGMRDNLLANSDWTQMPDSPLNNEEKANWQTYRQELRDLFNNFTYTNLEDVNWPTPPE